MSNSTAVVSVGSTLCLMGKVGPKHQEALWSWTVSVIGETEKAIKVTAKGASHKFAWLPKSVISNVVERTDGPGLLADISKYGGNLLRQSYIAREACDGEVVNHLGY